MKLVRVILLQYDPFPKNLALLNCEWNGVTIRQGSILGGETGQVGYVCVYASTRINEVPIDEEGFWSIPEKERGLCERSVEFVAKSLAVCNDSSVSFYTPSGLYITFEYETEEELKILRTSNGFRTSKDTISTSCELPQLDLDLMNKLTDRADGVYLFSEALGHSSESGGFRDYIRLFENAFALSSKQLTKKMVQFLNPKMGYTTQEINSWISLRDPLNHADFKKSKNIMLTKDIQEKIHRIKQAAYDVLINKKAWHARSKERRNLWDPSFFSNGENGMTVTPGSRVTLRLLDRFKVYQKHLNSSVNELPDIYWPNIIQKPNNSSNSDGTNGAGS